MIEIHARKIVSTLKEVMKKNFTMDKVLVWTRSERMNRSASCGWMENIQN